MFQHGGLPTWEFLSEAYGLDWLPITSFSSIFTRWDEFKGMFNRSEKKIFIGDRKYEQFLKNISKMIE